MTYTNNGTDITRTDVQCCTSKPWEDPVNGRNFKNDPERDDHLFDFRRPYHAKDDVRQLRSILKKLQDMGAGHSFDPDYKNNPGGKMRAVVHSGRKSRKTNKAYSSLHNDRNFETEEEHIAKDESKNNILWNWCGDEVTFDEGELKYYEETFGEQLKKTNENYIKSRHKDRCKTMDQWRKEVMHAPEETIYQIGKTGKAPDRETSLACFKEYLEWLNRWNDEHGKPFFILNWAMHVDEQGAPHFHLRKAWPDKDQKTGLVTTNQTSSLLKAGIEPPQPEKQISQKNNPKITFDRICREQWIKIARNHGLEIEDTPKPKNQVGKSLKQYQAEMDKWRNEAYQFMAQLTAANLGVMEKVAEWEELIPLMEKFDKTVEEDCRQARRAYDPEEFAKIVQHVVAAHAGDLKNLQETKDGQIKSLDRELNGYNFYRNYNLHHQFGIKEINEMLEQAKPDQLEKIAAVMKLNGYGDLGEWMNNTSGWWKQFPKGAEIQREMEKRERVMGY